MSITDKLTLLASSKEALRVKLGLPKNLPLSEYYKHSYPFDPMTLFAGDKQGVWFDPSDKSTLFQDVAGSIPATKDGDPVALMLDKSKGGEINYLYNKPIAIDSLDGWYSYTGKVKTPLGDSATITEQGLYIDIEPPSGMLGRDIELVEGVTYYFNASIGIASPLFRLFSETGAVLYTNPRTEGSRQVGYYKALKTETATFSILRYAGSSNLAGVIRSLVIKGVAGNHASQPLAARRPIYKTDGDLHWLELDGVDDYLVVDNVSIKNDLIISTSYLSLRTSAVAVINYKSAALLGISYNANKSRVFLGDSSKLIEIAVELGKPCTSIVSTSDSLLRFQVNKVVESRDAIVGGLKPSGFTIGCFGSGSWVMSGRIYAVVIVEGASKNTENLNNYIASKAGVTL